ncbi:ORF27, putative DNA polymerase [Penaeus vannamei]|uniref:ORF27, putative DNA polymerase n=1 Tax=Penaeus vannamei TaxID=6689 RepID=A0A423SXJ1_PENVA|nr:ORF27, putative DNA polymerase [Penaeus vannamei]
MNVSVVSAMYLTQLHIIEGAVLRAMGPERAFMRSCAIRCHSQYTKTLGGYVTTPLTKFQTLHAMDMGSLYPSAMRQNNLDTTTVCSHRQIIDCRNRIMMQIMAKKKPSSSSFSSSFLWGTPEALAIMDEANAFIMDRYRPCDLVVDSWKNNRKLKPNCCVTRQNCKTVIEQQQQRNHDSGDAEVTARLTNSLEDVVNMLEEDFTLEKDQILVKTRYSYSGNVCRQEKSRGISVLAQRQAHRLMSICVRIARRVYAYDSAKDEAVAKWSSRLLNVGNRCRVWNARQWILQGTIPLLQRRYREERVVLKRQVKLKAKSEPLAAAQFKVEEGVKKLFMNSIYGVLVLRVSSQQSDSISRWKTDNSLSRLLVGHAAEGVEGGRDTLPWNEENADYVYPHNGPELCRLLTDDERAILLNRQSGGAIFSDGPLLPIDRHDNDEVKENKLREIQTACLAWTQHQLFNYDTVVGGHAKRCLSYTEDPEDYITVSRVNKEQVPKKIGDIVTLPNPTARLINNHLNPSRVIELGEKILDRLGDEWSNANSWTRCHGKGPAAPSQEKMESNNRERRPGRFLGKKSRCRLSHHALYHGTREERLRFYF